MSGPFGSSQWMYNAGGAFYGHTVDNSVRFETGSNGHLTHTLGTAANRQINTTSFWVKRSKIGANQSFFVQGSSVGTNLNDVTLMGFEPDGNFQIYSTISNSVKIHLKTTRLFRDVGAWMHICVAIDTTQGTDTNRVKIYFNGVLYTGTWVVGTYPSQNDNTYIFSAEVRRWGRGQTSVYSDGYFAQIAQISGVQHAVGDFGELKNDIWIPKNITGLTYAAGSYLLEFKNSGVGTASSSTVGADTSGNDLHFTSSGLAVYDQVLDSPTNNFATLNPLLSDPSYPVTYSEGNLKSTQTNKYFSGASTIAITKEMGGKWYFEAKGISSGNFPTIGVMPTDKEQIPNITNSSGSSLRYTYHHDGTIWHGSYSSYGNSFDQDIIGVAFDWDNKKIYFSKNGTWQNSSNPANGTNPAFSSMTDGDYYFYIMNGAGASNRDQIWEVNFGQNGTFSGAHSSGGNADDNDIGDFLYDVPAGYLALCTANLPDPVETIDPAQGGSPQDYFNTVLYTGNGADNHAISGVGFQPDWVWMKSRNNARSNALVDSVRGRGSILYSDLTNVQEAPAASNNDLVSFDTDGFTVGTPERAGSTNTNNDTIVAWNWKAGTAFSNDASSTGVGSIDSSGSVNTDVGFSIISYTGNGTQNATIAHGLSQTPEIAIYKNRSNAANWAVIYTSPAGAQEYLLLNTAAAAGTASQQVGYATTLELWDDVTNNTNGHTYIAYAFHSVDGFSKIGSYTGNGNADGPFVYTGFRPAFVLSKETSDTSYWVIRDNKRNTFNPAGDVLFSNVSNVEEGSYDLDFLSNGFKLRNSGGDTNSSGNTYIYMAFAEQSQKYSNGR